MSAVSQYEYTKYCTNCTLDDNSLVVVLASTKDTEREKSVCFLFYICTKILE